MNAAHDRTSITLSERKRTAEASFYAENIVNSRKRNDIAQSELEETRKLTRSVESQTNLDANQKVFDNLKRLREAKAQMEAEDPFDNTSI